MSFPRYPKYKSSGVAWLGDVPASWSVTALKRVVSPDRQITYGIVQAGPHIPNGVPYIRPADMSAEGGIEVPDAILRTSDEIANDYSRSTIRTGDLVFSIGPSFGKVMVTPPWLDGANLTQGTARIAVNRDHHAKYIFWTLRAPVSVAQWDSSVGGATFRALNLGPLSITTILTPPLPEQTAIAEFLDRETAKIDALVAEQRRLMDLLKEKRQAVISHAVTKGLNPNAPMKPSGIEWLGDVPAGWATGQLRYLTELIVDGTHHSPQSLPNGDYLYITAKNIKEHGFDLTEITYVTEFQHREIFTRCPVRKGDVLYIKDGATAGVAMVNPLVEEFSLLSSVALIRTMQSKLIPEFIAYQLNASQFKNPALNGLVGGAMTRFTLELISRFVVSVPPIEEQRTIVARLDLETTKFDTLTAEAQRAIDLLQERRTALISAAVTGQIDVRQKPRN